MNEYLLTIFTVGRLNYHHLDITLFLPELWGYNRGELNRSSLVVICLIGDLTCDGMTWPVTDRFAVVGGEGCMVEIWGLLLFLL